MKTLTEEVLQAKSLLSGFEMDLDNLEAGIRDTLTNLLSLKNVEATIGGLLGGLGNIAIGLFSVLFILFFFLKESNITGFIFK
jgi:predicted PurR-regulated permease PerM